MPRICIQVIVLFFIFMLSSWFRPCQAASLLDQRIAEYSVQVDAKEAPQQFLLSLCIRANIPCGIELLMPTRSSRGGQISIVLHNTSVTAVLDEIVRRYPRYKWVLEDGIINLMPKPGIWDRLRGREFKDSSLDRIVKKFDAENMPATGVAYKLCDAAGLPRAIMDAGIVGKPEMVTVHLKEISLRNSFNRVVKTSGKSMWLFSPVTKEEEICAVNIYSWNWRRKKKFIDPRLKWKRRGDQESLKKAGKKPKPAH